MPIEAGAYWLHDILKSGSLYFPMSKTKIQWRYVNECGHHSRNNRQPLLYKFAHPAAAIFDHFGWRHLDLCSVMKGRGKSAEKWLNLEAPAVIKERFIFVKKNGMTEGAIVLARLAKGDEDALKFLLCNGCKLGARHR